MLLALDTSTRATSVALCSAQGVHEARDDPPAGERPGHARRLLPLAAEVLERGRATWAEIDRVAVGRGPGSFTGLRIGIATAKGLASALEIPLVGVSTLESLALGAVAGATEERGAVLAVMDARRGEVFAAAWLVCQGQGRPPALGQRILDPVALAPAVLADTVRGWSQSSRAIGEGAIEFREILERAGAVIAPDGSELHRVSAVVHCRLARTAAGQPPDAVSPEYLRLPDAELARQAAARDAH